MQSNDQVVMKYQVYEGLFLTLPFARLKALGVELPLFAEHCRRGLRDSKTPKEIVDSFLLEVAHEEDFCNK